MSKEMPEFQISKKEIFYSRFENRLELLKQKCKKIINMGSVGTIMNGAVNIGIGTAVGSAVGQSAGDVLGNARTGQILGGIAVGGLATKKAIDDYGDKKEEIKKSENIVKMLDNSELMKNIENTLYFEFQLAIELLSTSTQGIDRLIKFFIKKISMVGSQKEIISEDNHKNIKDLMGEIHHDEAFREEKRIDLTCESQTNLGWQLDELILHSPVLLMFQEPRCREGIYFFQIYTNNVQKYKFQPFRLSLTTKAEASHKYPVRIFRDRDFMFYSLRSFSEFKTVSPQKCYTAKVHHLEEKVGEITLRYLSPLILEFYSSLRKNRYDNDHYSECMNIFSKILLELAKSAVQNPEIHLIFIQNLRNICFQEQLLPLRKEYKDKWKSVNDIFVNLEKKYIISEEEIKKTKYIEKNFENIIDDVFQKTKDGVLPPPKIIEDKYSDRQDVGIFENLSELTRKAHKLAICSKNKDYYIIEINKTTSSFSNEGEKVIQIKAIISLIQEELGSNLLTSSSCSSTSMSSSSNSTINLYSFNSPRLVKSPVSSQNQQSLLVPSQSGTASSLSSSTSQYSPRLIGSPTSTSSSSSSSSSISTVSYRNQKG